MFNIILGIVWIVMGISILVYEIKSEIPKPPKGSHFAFFQDGYKIESRIIKGATYSDNDKANVHVLTFEEDSQDAK